jgi:hypothetical protein
MRMNVYLAKEYIYIEKLYHNLNFALMTCQMYLTRNYLNLSNEGDKIYLYWIEYYGAFIPQKFAFQCYICIELRDVASTVRYSNKNETLLSVDSYFRYEWWVCTKDSSWWFYPVVVLFGKSHLNEYLLMLKLNKMRIAPNWNWLTCLFFGVLWNKKDNEKYGHVRKSKRQFFVIVFVFVCEFVCNCRYRNCDFGMRYAVCGMRFAICGIYIWMCLFWLKKHRA